MGQSSQVLVLLCLSALVYFGTLKLYSAAPTDKLPGISISLESVLSGKYHAQHRNATWISNNELIYKDDDVSVQKFLFRPNF